MLKIKNISRGQIVSWIFSKIPISILGGLTRTNLIIPYYHVVSDEKILHVYHLYKYKNRSQFIEDLDFLQKKYSPITLHDLLNSIKTESPLPKNSFLLTFDDGFREMYDIVAPILQKKGISATFFINTAFIDNKTLCYEHKASILIEYLLKKKSFGLEKRIKEIFKKNNIPFKNIKSSMLSIKYQQKEVIDDIAELLDVDFNEYLWKYKPYLTTSQIMRLIKDGFTIGAHSIDHPLYSTLSLEDQRYQTLESVKKLIDDFNLDYGAFAFPYTDSGVSELFFSNISDIGLVDVSFGTGGLVKDHFPRNIQRLSLEKPLMPASRIIALQFARKIFRILQGKDKIIRN